MKYIIAYAILLTLGLLFMWRRKNKKIDDLYLVKDLEEENAALSVSIRKVTDERDEMRKSLEEHVGHEAGPGLTSEKLW